MARLSALLAAGVVLAALASSSPAHAEEESGPKVHFTVARGFGVRSGNGVLERRDGDAWMTVCEVPCDRRLDPRYEYRVAGPISATPSFRLGRGDSVNVRAALGTPFFKIWAVPTALSGAIFTAFGVNMLVSDKKLFIGDVQQPTAMKTFVAGTITTIGASLVIGGALMFFLLGNGSVEVNEPTPTPSQAKSPIRWSGTGVTW